MVAPCARLQLVRGPVRRDGVVRPLSSSVRKHPVTAWFILVSLSAITGIACARVLRGWIGVVCSFAVPWLGVLAWILYSEYFVPYRGGGASMWPIAQFFAGSGAAISGIIGYAIAQRFLWREA